MIVHPPILSLGGLESLLFGVGFGWGHPNCALPALTTVGV